MDNKERLAYLLDTYGKHIGNSIFLDVNSSIFFTFDDGRKWDIKWLDMDDDGDIYVVFHETDEKYYIDDFSDSEISMLLFVLSK